VCWTGAAHVAPEDEPRRSSFSLFVSGRPLGTRRSPEECTSKQIRRKANGRRGSIVRVENCAPKAARSTSVLVVSARDRAEFYQGCAITAALADENQSLIAVPAPPLAEHTISETVRFLGAVPEVISTEQAILLARARKDLEADLLRTRGADLERTFQRYFPGAVAHASTLSPTEIKTYAQGQPLLLSLGPEGLDQALLFGLLSRRQILQVSEATLSYALKHSRSAASYFVSLPHNVGFAYLDQFLEIKRKTRNSVHVGFFYHVGRLERELFALKAYLFSRLRPSDKRPFTMFFPLEHVSEALSYHSDRCRMYLGSSHPADVIRQALTAPSDLLFSFTHSNGLNMFFGPVVLCAKLGWDLGQAVAKAPPCFYQDICNRVLLPQESSARIGTLFIQSRVVFLFTCAGVLFSRAVYDTELSLTHQIACSPNVGILLTSLSGIEGTGPGLFFAKRYAENEPVGRVVAEVSAMHWNRWGVRRDPFLLFGDPEYRYGETDPIFDLRQIAKLPWASDLLTELGEAI
jgi:hypothetical protein